MTSPGFGRYAYDIMEIISTMGSISHCDKAPVLEVAGTAREMIHMSVQSLQTRDKGEQKNCMKWMILWILSIENI